LPLWELLPSLLLLVLLLQAGLQQQTPLLHLFCGWLHHLLLKLLLLGLTAFHQPI
jgi:hypothetical protein